MPLAYRNGVNERIYRRVCVSVCVIKKKKKLKEDQKILGVHQSASLAYLTGSRVPSKASEKNWDGGGGLWR